MEFQREMILMKKAVLFGLILTVISLTSFAYMQINGIDSSNFPEIKLYVSTDEGGIRQVTDNLNDMDFDAQRLSLLENSVVDIAFIFDSTMSMQNEIDSLYSGIERFADELSKTGIDFRLGWVAFGDSIRQVNDFTPDVNIFRDWVKNTKTRSGGDKPEISLDAMVRGLSLSYREDAQRLMVLVTDYSAHERGDGTSFSTVSVEETVNALQSFGISLFALGPVYFDSIAKQVGGIWKNIEKNREFSNVLDMIRSIIVEEYLVTYNVQDMEPEKLHEVIVKTYEADSGTYTSPPAAEVAVTSTKIISTGIGVIPDQFWGEPWGFIAAREAAIIDAQKRMMEIIKGVSLTGGQTVYNGVLADSRLNTAVKGWLSGAYVIEELFKPNLYLYEVKLGLDLIGETGLLTILRDLDLYRESIGEVINNNVLLSDLRDGWVKSTGFGVINKYDSKGEAIYKARAAAIADAQARLLEIIKGTYLESDVQIVNTMSETEITKTFEGVIRGAEVLDENILSQAVYGIDGLYKVEMGVSLTEKIGIKGIMINELGIPESQRVSENVFSKVPEKETVEESSVYTGLVLDASSMGLKEAIMPRILDKAGNVIYSVDSHKDGYYGAVFNYKNTLTEAKKDGVGDNPLILQVDEVKDCDVILSDASIEKLKQAIETNNFLIDGKVSVAYGG